MSGIDTVSLALHNPAATNGLITAASSEYADTTIRPILLIDSSPATWSTSTKPTTGSVNAGKTLEWGVSTDDNYYYDKTSVARPTELDYTPGFREVLFINGVPVAYAA